MQSPFYFSPLRNAGSFTDRSGQAFAPVGQALAAEDRVDWVRQMNVVSKVAAQKVQDRRLIDARTLSSLQSMTGRVGLAVAIEGLRQDCVKGMQEAVTAINNGNEAQARKLGHKFHGIFAQYGIHAGMACATNLIANYQSDWLADCSQLQHVCHELLFEVSDILETLRAE